ncbi:hypothetical protein [Paenibacillus massiliensis]|nr:hypothetical protein [Paenibacillus massiliensis]
MKKKFATLALIAVLSLSMASLASAAGVAPQSCTVIHQCWMF